MDATGPLLLLCDSAQRRHSGLEYPALLPVGGAAALQCSLLAFLCLPPQQHWARRRCRAEVKG